MAFWRLFYHFIWTTKKREPLLTPDIELRIHGYLRNEAEKLQCPLFYINGAADHMHVLASVRPSIAPSEFIKQLKGSSSRFVTKELGRAFEWQEDYGVLSISEADVPRVIEYVKNQKRHHAERTLILEFEKSPERDV